MPVTYKIESGQRIIRTRCVGDVTFNEVVDHFRVLQQDPECPERLDVLLDLTDLTSEPSADQLKGVSDAIGRSREKVHFDTCAIVASSDLLFGVSRMFEVFAEGQFRMTRVFRGLPEAEAWLAGQRSQK